MQDVCRYLLFSSAQGDGLAAQLHALGLGVAACAETKREPRNTQLWQGLITEHSRLLAKANFAPQAEAARSGRRAAIGAATAPVLQLDRLAPVSKDACFADVLHQGQKAKQQLSQATAVLQRKLAQQTAIAGRESQQQQPQQQQANTPGVQSAAEVEPSGAHGAGRRREISVPAKAQERKRDVTGGIKHPALESSPIAAAANARWSNSNVFAPASKRMAGLPAAGIMRGSAGNLHDSQQQHNEHEDISEDEEVEQHSNGISRAAAPFQQSARQGPGASRSAAAAAAGGGSGGDGSCVSGAGRPGFMTARNQLVSDLRKKGQHQQANRFNQAAPRTGLTRPRGSSRCAAGTGAGAGRPGFVPPFVGKAIDHHTGGSNGAAAGAGGEKEEGPLSARTLEMLKVASADELPEELAKCDPRLIEQVCNEVIDSGGAVHWDDIAGLDTAKHLIKEIVVWPMQNPHLFTGPRAPPKGILLFGPPGTGKTLIGKAVASNIDAAFFSISASSLTSKWIGEGEKMVKTLFAVAGVMQPSVIFIDEIDSILSARKSEGEHEASRRLKTEMLVQMEGCDPSSASRRVLLVGATNRPEELDEAARRRMPKQLYIPLPCAAARLQLILRQVGPDQDRVVSDLSSVDLDKLVKKTEGYSGSDMKHLIQEACQGPIRDAVARLGEAIGTLNPKELRPVRLKDFQHAAKVQRASVTAAEIVRYEEYNERHGAKYVEGDGDEADLEDDW